MSSVHVRLGRVSFFQDSIYPSYFVYVKSNTDENRDPNLTKTAKGIELRQQDKHIEEMQTVAVKLEEENSFLAAKIKYLQDENTLLSNNLSYLEQFLDQVCTVDMD
ncbi:hypothetical protein Pelo_49 [Pelomyxa schiedti]|nr:hypothetical protein Pelo_49 [Pelomyxa schiedti]